MVPLQVVVVAAVLAGGFYVGDEAVKGIKYVDTKIVHVVKSVGGFFKKL